MTKRNVASLHLVERDDRSELAELSDELRSALAEMLGAAREGLLAMSVSIGLGVFAEMMEEEICARVGCQARQAR